MHHHRLLNSTCGLRADERAHVPSRLFCVLSYRYSYQLIVGPQIVLYANALYPIVELKTSASVSCVQYAIGSTSNAQQSASYQSQTIRRTTLASRHRHHCRLVVIVALLTGVASASPHSWRNWPASVLFCRPPEPATERSPAAKSRAYSVSPPPTDRGCPSFCDCTA